MPTNVKWPEERKAEVLAALVAAEGNVAAVSRASGIAESTIRYWASRAEGEVGEELRKLRDSRADSLADKFETLAEELLGIAHKNREKASTKDAVLAAAIAVDKARLLRGEATAVTETRQGADEMESRAQRLAERYSAMKAKRAEYAQQQEEPASDDDTVV
jgi:transposase-like protein